MYSLAKPHQGINVNSKMRWHLGSLCRGPLMTHGSAYETRSAREVAERCMATSSKTVSSEVAGSGETACTACGGSGSGGGGGVVAGRNGSIALFTSAASCTSKGLSVSRPVPACDPLQRTKATPTRTRTSAAWTTVLARGGPHLRVAPVERLCGCASDPGARACGDELRTDSPRSGMRTVPPVDGVRLCSSIERTGLDAGLYVYCLLRITSSGSVERE